MASVRHFPPTLIYSVVLFAAGLVVEPTNVAAQDQGPNRVSVRVVDVKADGVAEFEAAMAERARLTAAAGWPWFHVYERLRGPNLPTYVLIVPDGDYNDRPTVETDEAWLSRIYRSVNANTLLTVEFYPELGVQFSDTVAPGGEFMRVRVRTVSPGNRQAYLDWHEDEFTPALREAGLTDVRVGRVIVGGNLNTFVRYTFTDNWATGVNALVERHGQAETDRLLGRESELLVSSEDYVARFRADLSFTAEP